MQRRELVGALTTRPFRPFRLYVTDGATYVIRHPDVMLVTPTLALIGVPEGDRPGPGIEDFHMVDLRHVTRLEPIEQPSPAQSPS